MTEPFWYCANCRAFEAERYGKFNKQGYWICDKCIAAHLSEKEK